MQMAQGADHFFTTLGPCQIQIRQAGHCGKASAAKEHLICDVRAACQVQMSQLQRQVLDRWQDGVVLNTVYAHQTDRAQPGTVLQQSLDAGVRNVHTMIKNDRLQRRARCPHCFQRDVCDRTE